MKTVAIVIFALLAVVYAADECTHHTTKHTWPAGESYNPIGECNTYKCLPGGGISAKTCPAVMAIGCEELPEDLTKPYPECCPKFKCP